MSPSGSAAVLRTALPRRGAWLLFLALFAEAAVAQTVLRPVDQATLRPEFFSFRAQLQAAVARRDAAAVRAVLHPDIKLSFGGDAGAEAFERLWRPEAADSPLWATLGTVLALGGSFGPGEAFFAPYVFSRWPEKLDGFEHVAVIGSAVRARAAPAADATPLATLDFALLRRVMPEPAAPGDWIAVRLADGRTGWLDRSYVRSPVDYRVAFNRIDGRWQMTLFVAGD